MGRDPRISIVMAVMAGTLEPQAPAPPPVRKRFPEAVKGINDSVPHPTVP